MKEKIGHRIKMARKEQNLTQEQLAEKTNLSTSFISRMETGKALPGIEGLYAISKALDVGLQDLLCDYFVQKDNTVEDKITYYIEIMTPRQQEHLLKYIEMFLELKDNEE